MDFTSNNERILYYINYNDTNCSYKILCRVTQNEEDGYLVTDSHIYDQREMFHSAFFIPLSMIDVDDEYVGRFFSTKEMANKMYQKHFVNKNFFKPQIENIEQIHKLHSTYCAK